MENSNNSEIIINTESQQDIEYRIKKNRKAYKERYYGILRRRATVPINLLCLFVYDGHKDISTAICSMIINQYFVSKCHSKVFFPLAQYLT